MSNITSTLSIRVNDDGFASKLQANAEAARRLGISAKDLGKLRASAGTAGMVMLAERLRSDRNLTVGTVRSRPIAVPENVCSQALGVLRQRLT